MAKSIDDAVRTRAGNRCEYCLMPQQESKLTFPIDHIIARQHGGETVLDNLALSCARCNNYKGPNIAGIDPESGQMSSLFHPRTHAWTEHFRYEGAVIVGLTPRGRATLAVLAMNHPHAVAVRGVLMEAGLFY